ncbi:protein-L-isoaspartate(D-aspartate) O-methyltransferase [Helicobacter cappadocius]|uniref:Protein-L-isoaspartate O-methyltransferase n=1 Tax=Helicobacter cappadocius TaxID=3063998 RepID=A0AA90PWB8_9HELI|nr:MULTISPECIES: protein-L-isoaspartate(D-aspartate) O-methyltransferase [unclassified Helicobacter]MDO7253572.1 protein-L-isoaspartate(D-aspartate) O-methyltransferase [Helicobacter sp. faydin-H75]MDP2539500.1 protein-L-isoaspartate(D-aspartate) O-methyltransferase [Helicobacter sp. faydin-H76]
MFRLKGHLMCDQIARKFPLQDNVKEAISNIDRELFVPASLKHLAYNLDALPMGADQWISSPLTVAKMTQYLIPEGGDSVLEIGCGSGYQAMVLSRLFRRVFSIERIEKLLLEAKERIRKSGISNINTKLDDGQNGWAAFAPYDRIMFSACVQKIPDAIIEQLEEGGILVAPIADGDTQVIARFRKKNNQLSTPEILEKCLFVPVLDGVMR